MPNWDAVKATTISLHCLAIIASLARLIYRTRTRRLWWDDFWAFISMLCDFILLVFFGTRYVHGYDPRLAHVRRAIFLIVFTSVLWAARLSVAVTIVRLVPPGRGHHLARCAAVLFALMWCGLLIHKLFICRKQFDDASVTRCMLPAETGIFEICTDLTADIWLMCSPAYLLWDTKLSNRRQIVIFSVFASDILLAAASTVHDVFILRQQSTAISISAYHEAAISLIVCNLLVLVTWLYSRLYPADQDQQQQQRRRDSENSLTTAPLSRSWHPNAPRYGFAGSVLVLTQVSTPSISLASTFSNRQSTNHTYARHLPKPRRTHSLDTLYPIITLPSDTLPSYLRSTRSCPALFHTTPMVTTVKPGKGYEAIRWDSVRFEARAGKTSPSLALSSDSESWNPTHTQVHATRGTPPPPPPPHNIPLHHKLSQDC